MAIDFDELRIGNNVVYKPQAKQKVFHNIVANRATNGVRDILYGGAAKGGKGIEITHSIQTSCGYKLMKDVKVGDLVIGGDGRFVRVIWESGVYQPEKCFEITFDNGEKIICDAPHLWRVRDEANRQKLLRLTDEFRERRRNKRPSRAKENPDGAWRQKNMLLLNKNRKYDYLEIGLGEVKETKDLFKNFRKHERNNYSIDTIAYQGEHLVTDLDPYLLGLWIGDGGTGSPIIGMLTDDLEECLSYVPEIKIKNKYYPKKYKQPFGVYSIEGLAHQLKIYGIFNNKRIPKCFLNSSYNQRLEILKGILDTDGHCNAKGQIEIGWSKEDLFYDLMELVSSLGIKFIHHVKKLSEKNSKHKDSHTIKFTAPFCGFKLKRKAEKQSLKTNGRSSRIYITDIKEVQPVPVKCIQVENPDGMYLIGRTFIPTHNSHALRWEAHKNCLQYDGIRGLLIRSSFPELERTHISRIQFDLPSEICGYNTQKHVVKYLNNSILELGYGSTKDDFGQYLSAEYDFIMIDELTTIPWEFSFLLRSRLAASRADFIPFWACATNPGDIAHVDVRAYFVYKQPDIEKCPKYNRDEVAFIPATVFDNKILMERDPGVLERLQQLTKKDQQKFLYGNWDIFEGQFFDSWLYQIHVIEKPDFKSWELLKYHTNLLAGLDYGNVTVLTILSKDHNGNTILVDEWVDENNSRSFKIESMLDFLDKRGLRDIEIIADTNMWIPDAFDVEYSSIPAEQFIEAGLNLTPVSKTRSGMNSKGYRESCNDSIKDALRWVMKEDKFVVKPKMKVYSRCKRFIESFPSLITDPKNPNDIADNQYDHCFIGDTKIATAHGYKKIKKIKVGEYVLTRNGFQKVLKTHKTKGQDVYQYLNLVGTKNHPIITEEGVKPIHNLTVSDILYKLDKKEYLKCLNSEHQKSLKLMGSNSDVIPMHQIQTIGIITDAKASFINKALDICTFIFGRSIIKEKCQRTIISIIKMRIGITILLRILSVKINTLIYQIMQKNGRIKTKHGLINTCKILDLLQTNGTKQKKLNLFIHQPLKKVGNIIRNLFVSAKHVIRNICPLIATPSSAGQTVTTNGKEIMLLRFSLKNVNSVKRDTWSADLIKSKYSAHTVVAPNIQGSYKGLRTVYNLTVENHPEYFANDILVHNCYDSFKMAFMKLTMPVKPKLEDKYPWLNKLKSRREKQLNHSSVMSE